MGLFSLFSKRPKQRVRPARVDGAGLGLPASERELMRKRGAPRPEDLVLSKVGQAWLDSLPPAIRAEELCKRYPRVANRVALCWNDPVLTESVFDDLLLDRRGTRQGFPPPVAAELLSLRAFNMKHRIKKAEEKVWEHRNLAVSDR